MPATMLIVTYRPSDWQRQAGPEVWDAVATQIAGMDGLRWKYWLVSEDERTRSGACLFDSAEQAAEGRSQLEASLRDAGGSDIDSRIYEVDTHLSAITRGMID